MKKADKKVKQAILEITPFIKLKWAIATGFSAVLMLVTFLLLSSYQNLTVIDVFVERIVSHSNEKSAIVYLLNNVARERLNLLLRMEEEENFLSLQENIKEFQLLGSQFDNGRYKLKKMSSSAEEKSLLQKIDVIVRQGEKINNEFLQAMDRKQIDDVWHLHSDLNYIQISLLSVMAQYPEIQQTLDSNLSTEINAIFNEYLQWLSLMIIVIISISGLVMFFVFRFVSEQQRNLMGMNHTMEAYNKVLKLTMDASNRANISKSEFIANMSHELRTPMTAIKGSLGILNSGIVSDIPKDAKDLISMADKNTTKLVELVTDVLDFSKLEAGEIEVFKEDISIENELEKFLIPFRRKAADKNIYLNVNYNERVPKKLVVDKIHLEKILTQLINNAIKFTADGGVRLEIDYIEQQIVVNVIDTGIGFEESEINFLFDSFVQGDGSSTRKFGGTGIGLAICKKLVEALNGNIKVSSELNKGSVFSLFIPVELDSVAA